MSRFIGSALVFVASTASAQTMPIDEFRPAIDSRGYLTQNGSDVLGKGELSFGLGSLQWGRHLLQFENGPATYSVDHMVTATLVGAVGLRLGGLSFELGGSLPFTIMTGERGPDVVDPANVNNNKQFKLDGQGVGDAGLHLKARLARLGRFGLSGIASVFVPTGSRDPFLGEPAVTPQLGLIADASFGRFRVAANVGVRLRRTTTFTDMGGDGTLATMGTITSSTTMPLGLAGAFALVPDKIELVGEVFGAAPLGAHHNYQSLEALGGVKVYLARNSYMSFGAGRGLVADRAGNPDFRAFVGIVFEPKPAVRPTTSKPIIVRDSDRDPGVADHLPGCVGLSGSDCPDADADRSPIADLDDRCNTDTDECKRRKVKVGDTEIVVLESIEFEFDKAVIQRKSHRILDAVAASLTGNPDIQLVEVRGHTDERGSDDYNDSLSSKRAAAVVTYLVGRGIAADRLSSQGLGKRDPLDRTHTEAAWAKNRRVEFVIRKRAGIIR